MTVISFKVNFKISNGWHGFHIYPLINYDYWGEESCRNNKQNEHSKKKRYSLGKFGMRDSKVLKITCF